jgi:hypothetical protein
LILFGAITRKLPLLYNAPPRRLVRMETGSIELLRTQNAIAMESEQSDAFSLFQIDNSNTCMQIEGTFQSQDDIDM